jgi:hypothetical protein
MTPVKQKTIFLSDFPVDVHRVCLFSYYWQPLFLKIPAIFLNEGGIHQFHPIFEFQL